MTNPLAVQLIEKDEQLKQAREHCDRLLRRVIHLEGEVHHYKQMAALSPGECRSLAFSLDWAIKKIHDLAYEGLFGQPLTPKLIRVLKEIRKFAGNAMDEYRDD